MHDVLGRPGRHGRHILPIFHTIAHHMAPVYDQAANRNYQQMEKIMRALWCIFLLIPAIACADATNPTKDVAGARDLPFLKRYQGSFIVDQMQTAFDEFSLPTGRLKTSGRVDKSNNRIALPEQKVDAEGKLSRFIYVAPAGRSPLEVIRNYEDELTAKGGQVLYRCKDDECGGDSNRGADAGGGTTGLLQLLYPADQMRQRAFTNGNCALNSSHAQQRYSAIQMTAPGGGEVVMGLLAYTLSDTLYCKALNDRTVLVMTTVEKQAREQRMVSVVPASDLSRNIGSQGHVAIYGIYFDTGKASLTSNSAPQLAEIAKMLKADGSLKVLVVGHTDNQGELAYNVDLSKRRAEAVIQALAQQGIAATRLTAQGVGMAAPVANNDNEEGRAKNRRVEIVKR